MCRRLEAAIVLQAALGDCAEAAIIAGLLLYNAALGLVQEGRAGHPRRVEVGLAVTASVRRGGVWARMPAAELVPGDVAKLSPVGGPARRRATH